MLRGLSATAELLVLLNLSIYSISNHLDSTNLLTDKRFDRLYHLLSACLPYPQFIPQPFYCRCCGTYNVGLQEWAENLTYLSNSILIADKMYEENFF